jgi:hypothetical protein
MFIGRRRQLNALRNCRFLLTMRKTIFAEAGSGFAIQELGLRKRAVTRPLRLQFAGTVYHLPARVNARQKILQ